MSSRRFARQPDLTAAALILRATVGLSLVFVGLKAFYLGRPPRADWTSVLTHARGIAAISFLDVVFAASWCAAALAALVLLGDRPRVARTIAWTFLIASSLACLYAVAGVVMFGVFGGFPTYSLIALVGNMQMLRSSLAAHLTLGVTSALLLIPACYIGAVVAGHGTPARPASWRRPALVTAFLLAWVLTGKYAYARDWATRQDRRIAENAHWVLTSSWWHAMHDDVTVRLSDTFAATDLSDFDPLGASARTASVLLLPATPSGRRAQAVPRRPPNVILIVLESVAARWTGLGGHRYETTPQLQEEAAQALVFDSFYAHVGRSSNSLGAILLSTYPKLDFQDLTQEFPDMGGTSLASTFRDRGYHTSFVTPSDLRWAGWDRFIGARGFDRVQDYRDLACDTLVSSWGVEDRCMVDAMIDLIGQDAGTPFFMMAWSQQTRHPYEPTPGRPVLDLMREAVHDEYDLGRYLNVLRETDAHLGRLFDAVRQAGLSDNTLIVITGDHGQAFGYPHDTYIQGRTIYEEDVHVPLMIWSPRLPRATPRPAVVGSHIDLAPTIAELAGVPAAPDWRGRSLFDRSRPPRAYFYVAEDHFRLGVREDQWKYIFDLREGNEELYDLGSDPDEQHNIAAREPARCARLRQRLSAWAESNRRQYAVAIARTPPT